MGRLRVLFWAASFALAAGGCVTTTTVTFPTGNADSEQVWVGALDAVSNYLHVDSADRQKGLIEARSDGLWERNLARIQLQKDGNQYNITVGAYVQASKIMTRPSGLLAGQEDHLSDLNTGLRDTLVREIKARLGVPKNLAAAQAAPAPNPAPPPKEKPKKAASTKAPPKPQPPAKTGTAK